MQFVKIARRLSLKTLSKMNTLDSNALIVSVRNVENDDRLQISLNYELPNGKFRDFNLNRSKTETVEATLSRLTSNLQKYIDKATKKKGQKNKSNTAESTENSSETVNACLISEVDSESVVNCNLENCKAWNHDSLLKINNLCYKIQVNLPVIKSINLSTNIMNGFPVIFNVESEFTDLHESEYCWLREEKNNENEITWKEICNNKQFIPATEEIGRRIKCRILPKKGSITGLIKEVESKCEVGSGPGFCPFEERHLYTKNFTATQTFRVVTYNLLADLYANTDYSREHLFSYCLPYTLEIDYRKQLFMKELTGYNADLICLQEVDKKIFVNDLKPTFELLQYSCFFKEKREQSGEGCAMLLRNEKFEYVDSYDIDLADVIEMEFNSDIREKLNTKETLKERVVVRKNILQLTLMKMKNNIENSYILVGNTHYYFHPKADHVRALQALLCVRYFEHILNSLKNEKNIHPKLVFCGDFNSDPLSGAVCLLENGTVNNMHDAWFAQGVDEYIPNWNLKTNLNFQSAAGYPKYTNYVEYFNGCLDYIFLEKNNFITENVVPLPAHEHVVQMTGLPNAVFPSDHLALICDVTPLFIK